MAIWVQEFFEKVPQDTLSMVINALASVQVIKRLFSCGAFPLLASALAPRDSFAVAEGYESCVSRSEMFLQKIVFFRAKNRNYVRR